MVIRCHKRQQKERRWIEPYKWLTIDDLSVFKMCVFESLYVLIGFLPAAGTICSLMIVLNFTKHPKDTHHTSKYRTLSSTHRWKIRERDSAKAQSPSSFQLQMHKAKSWLHTFPNVFASLTSKHYICRVKAGAISYFSRTLAPRAYGFRQLWSWKETKQREGRTRN